MEPTTKIASNVTGTIHPQDADDYMNMQFRYVSEKALVALGYKPVGTSALTATSRAPPVPATSSPVTKTSSRANPIGSSSAVPGSHRKTINNGNPASNRNGPSVRNTNSTRDAASSSSRQRQREEAEVESVDDELDDHDDGMATAVKETKVKRPVSLSM